MADGDLGAVRRTPRPPRADLAQRPVAGGSAAVGASNPPSAVSVDHGDLSSPVSSQALAELDRALWQSRTLRGLAASASPQTHRDLLDTILAAGWRPSPAVVRVFRYTKPNGPVYRAYPDGRVTRNGEDIDPSNLAHCESSVRNGSMTETSEPLPGSEAEDACPHCSPMHERPESRPWGVYVAPQRDGDGQPTHLVVQPSNGAHVAQSDADWLWRVIREWKAAQP